MKGESLQEFQQRSSKIMEAARRFNRPTLGRQLIQRGASVEDAITELKRASEMKLHDYGNDAFAAGLGFEPGRTDTRSPEQRKRESEERAERQRLADSILNG